MFDEKIYYIVFYITELKKIIYGFNLFYMNVKILFNLQSSSLYSRQRLKFLIECLKQAYKVSNSIFIKEV